MCFIQFNCGMVSIPANVPVFFVEELSGIAPSLVVYDYSLQGRDEFWWNLGHFSDAVASSHEHVEHLTMKAFMKDVKKIIGKVEEGGWLAEHSLYTQPVSRRKLFMNEMSRNRMLLLMNGCYFVGFC